jgi:hypothetical protein
MLLPMRRLLVPVFAVSMTVGGLAYAAGDISQGELTTQSNEDPGHTLVTGDDTLLETDLDATETTTAGDPTGSSGVTTTGRSTEGCPEGFSGNHGQFVSSTEDHPQRDAAHLPCGKPLQAVHDDQPGEPSTEEVESESDDGGPGLKKGHDKDKSKSKSKHPG